MQRLPSPASSTRPIGWTHTGVVNAVVIEVRRGRDGKLYPPRMPTPLAEREQQARTLAHQLHCGQGLSFRAVQAALRGQHGIRRSLGQVYNDLTRFECPRCADAAG